MALLAPLLIADVPPVLDYPNHLARLLLLHVGPDDPVVGRIFTPAWSILPNLAIDLIGPPLLRILPVHDAGRCLLALMLLVNLAGVVALHRAYFGQRSFWPLGTALVAYNSSFLFGFMNWQVGSGLAMVFAAGWVRWRDRYPAATIAGAALASVVLFFCHLMGVAFFLLLILSADVIHLHDVRSAVRRLAGLAPAACGPMILALSTRLSGAPLATHWVTPAIKLENAAGSFLNYVWPLDMGSAVLVFGGTCLGIALGYLVLAPRARFALVALPVIYVVLPFDLMSTSYLDVRVPVMAGYLVFAGIDFARVGSRARGAILAGGAALFAVRMAVVMVVWAGHRDDLAQLRRVIAGVPPGATVLLMSVPRKDAPDYWEAGPRSRALSNTLRTDFHLPALILIERGAYWSVLFANPAQQPIRLRPRYEHLKAASERFPQYAELHAQADLALPLLRGFDYMLLLEAGAVSDLGTFLPGCLTLTAHSDFAALFRVRADATRCAAPGN